MYKNVALVITITFREKTALNRSNKALQAPLFDCFSYPLEFYPENTLGLYAAPPCCSIWDIAAGRRDAPRFLRPRFVMRGGA